MSRDWTEVTRQKLCLACGKPDWCAWSRSDMLMCRRVEIPPDGMKVRSKRDGWTLFEWADNRVAAPRRWTKTTPSKTPATAGADVKSRTVFPTPEAVAAIYAKLGAHTAVWDYFDAERKLAMRVLRYPKPADPNKPEAKPPKQFRPVSRVEGGWVAGDPDEPIWLYRLPELLAAPNDSRVVVVEGERKCDAARELGWVVTTSAHGSGGAVFSDWSPVRGKHVVILIDRDKAGEKYGKAVSDLAYAAGALSVRIVRLWELWPEMPDTGDIVDLIEHRQNDLAVVRAEVEGLMDRASEEPKMEANAIRAPKERGSARMEFKPIPIEELGPSLPPDWVWPGFAAKGVTTLLTGMWKGGKSTLMGWLLHDLIHGGGLIPNPSSMKTLIISEESSMMWTRRRDDMKLNNSVHVVCRPFKGKPTKAEWFDMLERIADYVRTEKIDLVIFDTLGSLWPLENENDAAEVMSVILPTHEITAEGAALILIHHPRKGDGPEGQGSRGSGALPSDADILVELHCHVAGNAKDRRRVLKCRSRFDETPPETVLELQDDGYIVLGDKAETSHADRMKVIRELLPPNPPGKTVEELWAAWPTQPPPGKRTLAGDLERGFKDGKWNKKGEGVKNDPVRYFISSQFDSRRDPPLSARMESNDGTDAASDAAPVQKPRRAPRPAAGVAGVPQATQKSLGGAA